MRIAVTGGTGFVGSHLVDRLRADGHEAVVISRRTGHTVGPSGAADLAEAVRGCDGLRDRPVRPVAVDDVARILEAAALGDRRLAKETLAVLGPETMPLGEAVRRVALAAGQSPLFIRLPIAAHLLIARLAEWTMHVPLIATAQVHILAEGVVEPLPFATELPEDLAPATPFDLATIRRGLPEPGGFGRADLRCAT